MLLFLVLLLAENSVLGTPSVPGYRPFRLSDFMGVFPMVSLARCQYARSLYLTDAPPFDGTHVELHFVQDYNVTELEETIAHLGPDVVVSSHLCARAEERRKLRITEQRQRAEERNRRWKSLVESMDVISLCEKAKADWHRENEASWFGIDKPEWLTNAQCPCFRRQDTKRDTDGTLDISSVGEGEWLVDEHPCVEVACLKLGTPTSYCIFDPPGPSPDYPRCINTIKMRI